MPAYLFCVRYCPSRNAEYFICLKHYLNLALSNLSIKSLLLLFESHEISH